MFARYSVVNLLSSAGAVLSVSDEQAEWPRAYLHNRNMAIPFRFTGLGGWVELDAGQDITVREFILHNHNLSPSSSVVLKAGAASNPSTVVGTMTYRKNDQRLGFAATAARFWRWTVTDSAQVPTKTYTQLGEAVLSMGVDLTMGFDFQWPRELEHRRTILRTKRGVAHRYKKYDLRHWVLEFTDITAAELAELDALDEATEGGDLPMSLALDAAYGEVYYVQKSEVHATKNLTHATWSGTLDVWEQSRGADVYN